MIFGAFVGAIANAILLYCYMEFPRTDSTLPPSFSLHPQGEGLIGITIGLMAGSIIGGIIGLIQPKI